MRRAAVSLVVVAALAGVLVVALGSPSSGHRVRAGDHAMRAAPARRLTAVAVPDTTCYVAGGACGANACDEFISDDVTPPGELVLGSRCPRTEAVRRVGRPRSASPRGLARHALRRAAIALAAR